MGTTTFAASITSRTCVLPMLPGAMYTWRDRVDASPSNHNSIASAPAAGFASAKTGVVHGAAKQAAPPRGIPR